jgi:hypothetical protein
MPALQAFECLLIGIETETGRHNHPHIAFYATAVAVQVDLECFLSAGHAQVVNGKTINRYPGLYVKLPAMQIRAARLT